MSWRPEIPDPATLWEEWNRRVDEKKDDWLERSPIALPENRADKEQGKPNAKLVQQ